MTTPDPQSPWTQGNWYPLNFAILNRWLDERSTRRGIAVFDFDNTTIAGDVGESVFHYQVRHALVRLSPAKLASLLGPIATDHESRQLTSALIDAWAPLWAIPEEARLLSPPCLAWGRAIHRLYASWTSATSSSEKVAAGYMLLARLWAGFSPAEVFVHTQRALTEPLQTSPDQTGQGPFRPTVEPHMRALMQRLKEAGIASYIVSASFEPSVAAAAAHFDLPVQREHIFGLRTAVAADGRLTSDAIADYPVTYRQGKVDVIRRFIGEIPSLVAGDAMTDYDMLVAWPQTAIRLVINRNSRDDGLIKLYNLARATVSETPERVLRTQHGSPVTLLQGRDGTSRLFVPSQESGSEAI